MSQSHRCSAVRSTVLSTVVMVVTGDGGDGGDNGYFGDFGDSYREKLLLILF